MDPSAWGLRPGVPPQIAGYVPMEGEPRRQPNQGAQQVPSLQFHHQLVGRQQMHPWQISQPSNAYDFYQPHQVPIESPYRNPRRLSSTVNTTPTNLPTSPLGQLSPSFGAYAGSTLAPPGSVPWTPSHLSQHFNIPDLYGVTPQTPLLLLYKTPIETIPPLTSLPNNRYRDPSIHQQNDFAAEHQQPIPGTQHHAQGAAIGPQYRLDTLEIPHRQNPPNTQDSQTGPSTQHHEDTINEQNQQRIRIIDRWNQCNRQYQRGEPGTQHRQDSADTQNRPDGFDANRSEGIRNQSAGHRHQELDVITREASCIGIPGTYATVANRPVDFVKIAQKHANIKYNDFFIENGLLEIGRKFGALVVSHIMLGVSDPIRNFHVFEDLSKVLDDLDKEKFREEKPMTMEEAIAPGTIVLAVSYRHHPQNKEGRPGQKMADRQKADLLQALNEIFDRKKPQRILLWIDQAWTQRIGFCRKKWLGSGILAYFAFDVLLLEWGNDSNGLWLYLERKIAEADSKVVNITQDTKLYEKRFDEELINNITLVASKCTGDSLNGMRAYEEDDKGYVRRWAENLQHNCGLQQHSQALPSPRGHNTPIEKILFYPDSDTLGTSFAIMIENYPVDINDITWCEKDKPTPGNNHAWNGLLELMGKKNHTLPETKRLELQEFLSLLGNRYVFKIFSFGQSDGVPRHLAIGRYKLFRYTSRIILCDLSGCDNSRDTFVTATCVLDAFNFSPDAAEFILAFQKLTAGFWETVDDKKAYLKELLDWKLLSDALKARGFDTLHDYIETIQAKHVKFSACSDR